MTPEASPMQVDPTTSMKTCRVCQVTKSLDDFYASATNRDGRMGKCKRCVPSGAQGRKRRKMLGEKRKYSPSEEVSARNKVRQRVEIINNIKTSRGCTDCGYSGHPAALDFDHLPGFLKTGLISAMVRSRGSRQTLVRVLAEIAKCEVVCANCHRIRTVNRRTSA